MGFRIYGMSLERLEVAASGLSFVMSIFPLSINKKEEKEEKTKKIEEEDINLYNYKNREEKTQHNLSRSINPESIKLIFMNAPTYTIM